MSSNQPAPLTIFASTPPQAINIIFDGPPDNNSPHFVEVEDDSGSSIRIGEWIKREDYWALRITLSDLLNQMGEDEGPVAKEQGRWQKAIHSLLNRLCPGAEVDGSGCDSGDPLDLTLAEIGQAIGWVSG